MSRLAQAGLSSTASPLSARANAASTAASSVALRSNGMPVAATTRSIAGASRPIVTTARAWRDSGAASGAKSWPLPSPPRMTTSFFGARSLPRPTSAATVAPTLVPLLSSKASTPSTLATCSTRCGSPRYSRSACSIGASGQPIASASASAASALSALWRPRMRSASAGIRCCRTISPAARRRVARRRGREPARPCRSRPRGPSRPAARACRRRS